jgi:hypothetical protein
LGACTIALQVSGAGIPGELQLEVFGGGIGIGGEGARSGDGLGRRLIGALALQFGGRAQRHGPPGMRVPSPLARYAARWADGAVSIREGNAAAP